ncbi:polysaccharide pyruvyl transferase family protein [Vibrio cyclitrophicus]
MKRYITLVFKSIDTLYNSFITKNYVPVKYFNDTPNWGDELNHYLVEKITKKKVVRVTIGVTDHLLAIGSVLRGARRGSVVWGSGFIDKNHIPRGNPQRFCSCRGPLTWNKLNELGFECPQVYGDPGLLISKYYEPKIEKKYKLGFVPHYTEKNMEIVNFLKGKGVKIVDIQLSIEDFVDELLQCENIISSSLHGLVASDSYNIPNRWVKISDRLLGGDFKFNDYHLGVGVKHSCHILEKSDSVERLIELCESKKIIFDADTLLAAFPHDKF